MIYLKYNIEASDWINGLSVKQLEAITALILKIDDYDELKKTIDNNY